jgi:glycosyltransferase involved in cell wall biosynthesis
MHVHGDSIGYGRLGVRLSEALTALGVDVYDDLGEPPEGLSRKRDQQQRVESRAKAGHTNVVSWVSTPGHASWWWSGQHTSIFTMWEATHLPESFRESMHEFATIVVPSLQNLELFSKYHDNVRYCPLGIDPKAWHYTPREDPGPFFRFLIGGSGARKGTDLAHQAFCEVFPNPAAMSPVPRLVMKNPKGESGYTDRFGRTRSFMGPNVEMVSGRLSAADEISLYESCHAYVQPSRGEGFGLQPLQAMAQGMPTILTNAHGHEAFADLGVPIGYQMKKSDYFIFGEAGDWWEPDFDALCAAMWDVYSDYARHVEVAKDSARIINEGWTWRHTAEAFVDAHDGALDKSYLGDGSYNMPVAKRYLTILDRDYTAEIADGMFQWRKAKRYYERADVKRILYEAGVLDPACLENLHVGDDAGLFDLGLAEHQVARIPEYTGEREWCATCHQRLGTGEQRSDFYLEELANQGALA